MALSKSDDVGAFIGNWIVESAKENPDIQRIRLQMLKVSAMAARKELPVWGEIEGVWGAIYGCSTAYMLPIRDEDRKSVLMAVLKKVVFSATHEELDAIGAK